VRRLSEDTLADLPPGVERPGYDRAAVKTGVVHLGVGAFHRAHQAVVFDDAIRSGDDRWGVVGASLRSPTVAQQLNPQDGLYTLHVRDGVEENLRVIGAVRRVVVGPQDPIRLVSAMARPDVHLVTLTVTEKGYLPEPDVFSRPTTAAGFIVAALAERRAHGIAPFTAISCDNLPGNGRRLQSAVVTLARMHDPALADWIETHGAFPDTMVDRIAPATTPHDIDALAARLGVRDEAMVKTEPFTQWVIEDRFAGERPDFDALGATVTAAVAPWETAKLRMLNGAHSAVAYIGGLAGVEFVHEFVSQPQGAAYIEGLWDETQSTFDAPPGLDLAAYRVRLMTRFRNPALQHRTRQIAMDGSQKLPQRLVAPMAVRLRRGQSSPHLARAIAAWMRWQGGRDNVGRAFSVDDPLAPTTRALLAKAGTPQDQVKSLLSVGAIFPREFALNERACIELATALTSR
jgi:fructuronate reductase